MKLPCAVIRDLLPLYAEKLVEPETKALIEQHLEQCADCRKRLPEAESPSDAPVETAKPLQSLRRELKKRRRYAALLAALCVFIGVYTYFFHATEMRYVPWEDGLIEAVRVEALASAEASGGEDVPESDAAVPAPTVAPASAGRADEALILNVRSFVNGFEEHAIIEEDGTTTVILQAVSTGRQSESRTRSYTEYTFCPVPDRLIYGFEPPQQLLWGSPMEEGVAVLPRLALAYYLLIAVASAVVFGLLWALFRKRSARRIWRQLFFAPVSYLLAHLLLKGTRTTSSFLEHDLRSILFVALAVYALFSVAWQVFLRRRREAPGSTPAGQ